VAVHHRLQGRAESSAWYETMTFNLRITALEEGTDG
jgi:hypothetical protein